MHGNGESSGVAGGRSLGMARHAETAPDAAVRSGDTRTVSPTDEGQMANWNSNFEVMLEGRPELRQELARYQLDAMVPMVQVMEWLRQFAGLSESITTHARAQGSRMRDLEKQVEDLTQAQDGWKKAAAEGAETAKAARGAQLSAVECFFDVAPVVVAACRETDAEMAHNADGTWPVGTLEALQVMRHERAEAVAKMRAGAKAGQRIVEVSSYASIAKAMAATVEDRMSAGHPSDCTGCAVCETAGA